MKLQVVKHLPREYVLVVRKHTMPALSGATMPEPDTQDPLKGVKRFDATVALEAPDEKKFTVIKDEGGTVLDYRDVKLSGYLATFKGTTESDRQGDYVEPGAFRDTIKKFMDGNPIMLRDHLNRTEHAVGKFTVMREDKRGLYFEAIMSNAPDAQSIRFKVAEGILRTVSMGGLFHYKEDGRGIFKVDLWEGSVTPIPANPDAQFGTRSLTEDEVKKYKAMNNFVEEAQAEA